MPWNHKIKNVYRIHIQYTIYNIYIYTYNKKTNTHKYIYIWKLPFPSRLLPQAPSTDQSFWSVLSTFRAPGSSNQHLTVLELEKDDGRTWEYLLNDANERDIFYTHTYIYTHIHIHTHTHIHVYIYVCVVWICVCNIVGMGIQWGCIGAL